MSLTSKILAICLVILLFFSFSFYVGYSYRDYLVVQAERQEQEAIAKKQQTVTKERQDTNDVLNNQKQEQAKANQEIQNTKVTFALYHLDSLNLSYYEKDSLQQVFQTFH